MAAPALPSRRREVWFFLATFLVALCLALGDRAPVDLYALLWRLPVFSSTRVPGRYLFLALFSLAMLAGLGLDALHRALAERPRAAARLINSLTAGAVGVLAAFLIAGRAASAAPEAARRWLETLYLWLPGRNMELKQVGDPLQSLLVSLDPTAPWTARSFALLGLALALLWLWRLRPASGSAVRIALVVLTAVDLLSFARDFHPRLPVEAVAARGPAARFLAEHNGPHRVLTVAGVWETAPNRLVPLGIDEAGGYSSLLPDRHQAWLRAAQQGDERLLDVMGVRYLVVRRSSPPPRLPAGRLVFQDQEVDVYERSGFRPRAWLAGWPIVAGSASQALALMQQPGFEPASQVVIERQLSPDDFGPLGAASPGSAELEQDAGERVRVRVQAARPAFLVLADTFYPGWTARVDGVERPIWRADYLFRAVAVPAGEHVVDFSFEPLSFRVGAVVSGLTVLALAAAVAGTLITPRCGRARQPGRALGIDPALGPAGP